MARKSEEEQQPVDMWFVMLKENLGKIAASWNRLDKAVARIEAILEGHKRGEPIKASKGLVDATKQLRRIARECPVIVLGGPRPKRICAVPEVDLTAGRRRRKS